LYDISKICLQKKKFLFLQEGIIQSENQVRPLKNSRQIVEKLKRKRLSEIFGYLDSDKDGEISAQKIDIT